MGLGKKIEMEAFELLRGSFFSVEIFFLNFSFHVLSGIKKAGERQKFHAVTPNYFPESSAILHVTRCSVFGTLLVQIKNVWSFDIDCGA